MKVLHVIPSVGPLRGGPSVMLRTMVQALAEAGVTVDVATTDDNGPGRLTVINSKPVVEGEITYRYFRRQSRFYTFSWPLASWLGSHVHDYDLLHIHALFSYPPTAAAYHAQRADVPYVARPLGVLNRWGMRNRRPWLKKSSFRLIERRILDGARAIHYTSEQERLEAADLGIEKRSVIIPNAATGPGALSSVTRGKFRARYPQLGGRPIILFVSRLDTIKGLDILLAAFARARAQLRGPVLVLAGNGEPSFVAELKRTAASYGISSDIIWAGFLEGSDKWIAMADADIFVLPSYSESFGIAVAEAMTAGLPVIVSDQVGIHREIARSRAGLVVSCDTDALAHALIALMNDAKLRSEMAANGTRLAQTQFSADAISEGLVKLYKEICGTRLPRTAHAAHKIGPHDRHLPDCPH